MDASLYYTHLKRAGRNIETNLNGTFTTKAQKRRATIGSKK